MARKLTARIIDAEPVPAKGGRTLWDSEIRGLGIRINTGGAKSFFLNYWFDGIERRKTIGRFGEWSLEAARAEAKELRRQIDRGHNPAADKRERREAPTVQDLIDRTIRDHLPTRKIEGYRLRAEIKKLEIMGDYLGRQSKVADIHGGDIQDMHQKISEAGGLKGQQTPVQANRILAMASAAFGLSLVPLPGENKPWRNPVQGNPCKGVKKNHEDQRGKLFSQAELAAIGDALMEYGAEARGPGIASAKAAADCLRLIMLTGCRPTEARLAQWPEFSEAGFWIKPSAHTKQKREHRLPLAPPAIELIERLQAARHREGKKPSEWVFPGQVPGAPLQQLRSIWDFIRDRAKLAPAEDGHPARIYDLRHSYASMGAGGGLSLQLLGRLLGHTQARTTERYARHMGDDPVRAAAEKIATMFNPPKADDNVTAIGKAR